MFSCVVTKACSLVSTLLMVDDHLFTHSDIFRGALWLSGRASDSGARARGFETYLRRVVSSSKTLYSRKVLVIPRKRWLHPNMTEKLLTGTLSLNTNKQTNKQTVTIPIGSMGKG